MREERDLSLSVNEYGAPFGRESRSPPPIYTTRAGSARPIRDPMGPIGPLWAAASPVCPGLPAYQASPDHQSTTITA